MRKVVYQSADLLDEYGAHRLLREAKFHSLVWDVVNDKYSSLRNDIERTARPNFASYDHFSSTRFVDIYPYRTDWNRFDQRNYDSIEERLNEATAGQILKFHEDYTGPIRLGEANYHALSNAYVAALLPEPRERASLREYLRATEWAEDVGFEPVDDGRYALSVVDVSYQHLANRGIADFQHTLSIHPIARLTLSSADNVIESSNAVRAANYVVIYIPLKSIGRTAVSQTQPTRSEYLVGYTREPNPDRESAELDLREAESDIKIIVARLDNMPDLETLQERLRAAEKAKDKRAIGRLTRRIERKLKLTADLENAEQRFDSTINLLRGMPLMIDVPVHQEYRFNRLIIEATKNHRGRVFVVDRNAGRLASYDYATSDLTSFVVVDGLHKDDIHRRDNLAGTATQDDIRQWLGNSVEISFEQLLDSYMAKGAANEALPLPGSLQRAISSLAHPQS